MTLIPVIDLQHSTSNDDDELGKQLLDALSTVGFVYLKNSGISRDAVKKVNETTKQFFEISTEEKRKFTRNPEQNFGYVALEAERTDNLRPADYKETFDMSGDVAFSDLARWPDHLIPEFSFVCKEFMKKCKMLGLRILDLLSIAMELHPDHGLSKCHQLLLNNGNKTTLRSLYYPPLADNVEFKEGQLRCGEHTDYGTITLLFQDNVGGLQLLDKHDVFVDALPLDDTVLVNVGDTLQSQTCGQLKSTMHRVVNKGSDVVRRSLVYFIYADADTVINRPLIYKEGAVGALKTHDPDTPPITALEHAARRWNEGFKHGYV